VSVGWGNFEKNIFNSFECWWKDRNL